MDEQTGYNLKSRPEPQTEIRGSCEQVSPPTLCQRSRNALGEIVHGVQHPQELGELRKRRSHDDGSEAGSHWCGGLGGSAPPFLRVQNWDGNMEGGELQAQEVIM